MSRVYHNADANRRWRDFDWWPDCGLREETRAKTEVKNIDPKTQTKGEQDGSSKSRVTR